MLATRIKSREVGDRFAGVLSSFPAVPPSALPPACEKDCFMLGLSGVLEQWLGSDRITTLAERVAGRSRMGVWQRVMHRLPTLGPTEARGYLRARAMTIVREETSRLIEQEGATLNCRRTEIEETAVHLLVGMIAAQVANPRAQMPARRAA
jgi:hypothetical protein